MERAAAAAGFLAGSGLADLQTAERGVELLTGDRRTSRRRSPASPTCRSACARTWRSSARCSPPSTRPRRPTRSSAAARRASPSATSRRRRRGPERCLAAHPYNPPHLVPLVELAPGALTSPEAMERAAAFYAARRQGAGQAHPRPARLPRQQALRRALARGRGPRAARRGHRRGRGQGRELRARPALGRHGPAPALRPRRRRGGHRRPRGAPGRRQGGHAARPRHVDHLPARDRRGARRRPRRRRRGRAPTTSWSRNATPCSSPTCAPAASSSGGDVTPRRSP